MDARPYRFLVQGWQHLQQRLRVLQIGQYLDTLLVPTCQEGTNCRELSSALLARLINQE